MRVQTRNILDKSFSALGFLSIFLLVVSLVVVLGPIFVRGSRAMVFRATVEHRQMLLAEFNRGNRDEIDAEVRKAKKARQPVFDMLAGFEPELDRMPFQQRQAFRKPFAELKKLLRELLGPLPDDTPLNLPHDHRQYGEMRWDNAQAKLQRILYIQEYDYSDTTQMGKKFLVPRIDTFRNTTIEPLFDRISESLDEMLLPELTFYWGFLLDESHDAHFLGGIWPELLGTFYLTLGAIIIAVPLGVIAAIYLVEYAKDGKFTSILRTCISTLAGVPSIVFGLFGLAFFLNTIHLPKSVLAGSLTLALLILPTVIRSAEEAIRAVPHRYKEAAFSLGASKWHAIATVVLPAALPGILTGVVISMGRAAGETAPIIFTAAVSVGKPIHLWQTLSQPTPALPWNIYNISTEHQKVDQIRHVQYGMVLALVLLVLALNLVAIYLRARVSRRLKG